MGPAKGTKPRGSGRGSEAASKKRKRTRGKGGQYPRVCKKKKAEPEWSPKVMARRKRHQSEGMRCRKQRRLIIEMQRATVLRERNWTTVGNAVNAPNNLTAMKE